MVLSGCCEGSTVPRTSTLVLATDKSWANEPTVLVHTVQAYYSTAIADGNLSSITLYRMLSVNRLSEHLIDLAEPPNADSE